MFVPASRALFTPCSYEMHSIEPSRPRLTCVLSPLMSFPFAFRNRCTVSAMTSSRARPPPCDFAPRRRGSLRRSAHTFRETSLLVELPHERERERRPHVLEV